MKMKKQIRYRIFAAALFLMFLLPGKPAFANHVFYPEGTDYWLVEPLSGPLQFPRQEGNWRTGPDGREYYYKDGVLQTEYLTPDNHYNEVVMTALRTCEGIDTATLADDYHDYCLAQAKPFLANGLLENDGTWLRLTREGLFVSDMVMTALMRVEE